MHDCRNAKDMSSEKTNGQIGVWRCGFRVKNRVAIACPSFLAVSTHGKQVAVLVPTTLLASNL